MFIRRFGHIMRAPWIFVLACALENLKKERMEKNRIKIIWLLLLREQQRIFNLQSNCTQLPIELFDKISEKIIPRIVKSPENKYICSALQHSSQ